MTNTRIHEILRILRQFAWFQLFMLLTIAAGIESVQCQNIYPEFPPDSVTRLMDRDQMLDQFGIAIPILPKKLEDPNAPADAFPKDSLNPEGNWTDQQGHTIVRSAWGLWNNCHDISKGFFPGTDTARLGNYTPIDLLEMNDGRKVTTVEQWWNERQPEILKDLQEQLYGSMPPDTLLPPVSWSVKSTNGGQGNAAYLQNEIRGTIDISSYSQLRDTPVITATLRLPAKSTKPIPVLIRFGGSYRNVTDQLWAHAYPNGWGICIFDPRALQPDNGAFLTSYLIGLANKGNWREPADWGTLAAWSWGISRLIDYFETDEDVDASKLGLTGHSRYGKATLLTMAYEPRLAIGFPSDGGSLGTAMNRRHWGQDLENSGWENEYHWMAGNFFKWAGELVPGQYLPRKIENCAVDAHSLLALCAPRPMLFNGGTQSSWTDPYGQYLTTVNASPVYELLGKQGMIMPDEKPRVNVAYTSGDLAYRYHQGGHTDQPEWPTFFEFASKYFKSPMLTDSTSPDAASELPRIESRVYSGVDTKEKTQPGQTTNIFKGSTTHLAHFEVNSVALNKGAKIEQSDVHPDFEELIIIKEGQVSITINGQPSILTSGSIAFILPEDGYRLENIGSAHAHYYSLKYRSKAPMDLARGIKAGGSFIVHWDEIAYREHDKGGRRDFFDRGTAMCEDFEMHVTNLNENTSSHAPHTHDVEEIILMVDGDIQMHVDGKEQHATENDLAFLDSNVPHAPTNIGDGQCIYFAFQWK